MDAVLELLEQRGAGGLPHPGGTLLEHLRRVHATLRSWAVSDPVAHAGLAHAAYGTDGFPRPLLALDERPVLRAAIGEEAERLVYTYCACDRDAVYPRLSHPEPEFRDRFTGSDHRVDRDTLRAFATITAANEIDVAHHNPEIMAKHGAALRDLFQRMRPHLDEPARRACAAAFPG